MATTERKQFGHKQDGLVYRPRAGAYGILARDRRIVCARIGYDNFTYDFPGGGVDPGETPEQAVAREFVEEVGLRVRVGRKVTEIQHYFIHDDGTPYNNLCHFFEVEEAEDVPALKVEADHARVWLTPEQVIINLKNEGYAWAFVLWMRDCSI